MSDTFYLVSFIFYLVSGTFSVVSGTFSVVSGTFYVVYVAFYLISNIFCIYIKNKQNTYKIRSIRLDSVEDKQSRIA